MPPRSIKNLPHHFISRPTGQLINCLSRFFSPRRVVGCVYGASRGISISNEFFYSFKSLVSFPFKLQFVADRLKFNTKSKKNKFVLS